MYMHIPGDSSYISCIPTPSPGFINKSNNVNTIHLTVNLKHIANTKPDEYTNYLLINKYYNSIVNNYGSETEKIRKHNKRKSFQIVISHLDHTRGIRTVDYVNSNAAMHKLPGYPSEDCIRQLRNATITTARPQY